MSLRNLIFIKSFENKFSKNYRTFRKVCFSCDLKLTLFEKPVIQNLKYKSKKQIKYVTQSSNI